MSRWQPPSVGRQATPSPSLLPTNKPKERTQERRGVLRQEAGWVGKWSLADDPIPGSFECKVLDVSILGAGIEVYQLPQVEVVGRRITVTTQPMAGGSISIRFAGTIRHVGRSIVKTEFRGGGQGRSFRLGIEFAGLSHEELTMLDALGQFLTIRT